MRVVNHPTEFASAAALFGVGCLRWLGAGRVRSGDIGNSFAQDIGDSLLIRMGTQGGADALESDIAYGPEDAIHRRLPATDTVDSPIPAPSKRPGMWSRPSSSGAVITLREAPSNGLQCSTNVGGVLKVSC
jgi:hypothetical protein